jgi:tRNA(adenine34) deaminase
MQVDHEHFMRRALAEADKAMAVGEFPVGCVLVHSGRILVGGARKASRADRRNELDHAEIVTLRRLNGLQEPPIEDLTLYCTMEPCLMCFAAIMLAGIGTIVYAYEDAMGGGTACDLDRLPPLYRRRRPRVLGGVLRQESLTRFQAFFADPQNDYWRGSALADYTLSQELVGPHD